MAEFLWAHADDLRPTPPMTGMGIQVVRTADFVALRARLTAAEDALRAIAESKNAHPLWAPEIARAALSAPPGQGDGE